jgi:integrase
VTSTKKTRFRTDRDVRLLKPRTERYEAWDTLTPGFGVRVSPAGRKSFFWLYRFEGLARRMTFGTYPRLSLTKARARQAEAHEILEVDEKDPGAELVKTKRANREAPTVNDLAADYMEKHAKRKKRSWRQDEYYLDRDVLPAIGRKKAADVVRKDIINILDEIVQRGSPIAANRALSVIRKMFRFGVSQDIIPHNPCEAIEEPSKERKCDRVLDESEIKSLWNKLESDCIEMTDGTRSALKLLLVTAQRRVEVTSARWSDIDLSSGWWTIPAEITKNTLPHRVPLSPQAIRIFRLVKKESGDSDFVFPYGDGTRPIRPDVVTKALRKNAATIGVNYFTPHDLRRTAASLMASNRVPRLTIGKILNHAEPGVTATYDRHSYDPEKRQALNAWARKLEGIVTGKKARVIELKTG